MFQPQCLPILIGSLPVTDYKEAVRLILRYCPDIPLWPQLPKNSREGMVRQFLSGFPGLVDEGKRHWIDTKADTFAAEMTSFYEDYIQAEEENDFHDGSRFGLGDNAGGFAILLESLAEASAPPLTVKGQVTGPVTTGIGSVDQDGKSIFYDDNLRDILVKLLAQKGRWQALALQKYCRNIPPIIFIDEPSMVSFGSSAFTGISKEMVTEAVTEVISGIHRGGGLAGVHICANGDWEPALGCPADIISFDAYSYFDNFILYRSQLIDFITRGGILAWGIVPTGDPISVRDESSASLFSLWQRQLDQLAGFGFTHQQLISQTLIAPACGTGSLSIDLATKVLDMTSEISDMARQLISS